MATYTSRDGEQVTIEKNEDGSYTVTGEDGESATYGASSAEHIAQDWDIDFGSFENDPMFGGGGGHQGEGGGDEGGGDEGGGDEGGGDEGGGDEGGGGEGGGDEGGGDGD